LSFSADTPEVMSGKEAVKNHLLVRVVRPEYGYEARARHIQGHGVFDLRFDYETGHLREVHIVNALPDPLQKAALAALKQWQAKPRSIHTVRIPIAFVLGSPSSY
jgi:TonB family protein